MSTYSDASKRATHRRTKIIATVGPASRSPEKIRDLIKAGANVFRLNFSHGSHSEHAEVLRTIRAASRELGIPIGVLQDLSGPKIRITPVEGDFVTVKDGAAIELRFADRASGETYVSSASKIFVETVNPSRTLSAGHHVLLADGIITLQTLEVHPDRVLCTIVKGGRLRSRVGIAFPDSKVDLPATTEKDLKDLEWGIAEGVDFAAISFVRNAADIITLRDVIRRNQSRIQLIAKIERHDALENIDEIVEVADGVMVARGDLGLELPLEQVPLIQKKLIAKSNYRGIPVIVATQMLHSMITSVRPTRAEVTDIAFAVMSGADAVMLSEETAIGEHPVTCVEYLGRIASEAETTFDFDEYRLRLHDSDRLTVPDAVAYAACAAAIKVHAEAIIACSHTGNSARLVAKYRPQQPLYGTSTDETALRRMALLWGVRPVYLPTKRGSEEIDTAIRTIQTTEGFAPGTRTVVIGGLSPGSPGSTSQLQIREFPAA